MELEQLIMVIDTAKNLEGLRRDMRSNAEEYKSRLEQGQSVESVQNLILANNIQYKRRLLWIKNLYDNNGNIFTVALQEMNITITHTLQIYQELKGIADATDTADLSTAAKIETAANYVLTTLPAHLTVWA